MRLKHLVLMTVSEPHICDWFELLTHNLDWAVEKNFVKTVRAVEWLIGVDVPGCAALGGMPNTENLCDRLTQASALNTSGLFTPPVVDALTASLPMLLSIAQELEWTIDFTVCQRRLPIVTKFIFTHTRSL